jgi:hypothetical protein
MGIVAAFFVEWEYIFAKLNKYDLSVDFVTSMSMCDLVSNFMLAVWHGAATSSFAISSTRYFK